MYVFTKSLRNYLYYYSSFISVFDCLNNTIGTSQKKKRGGNGTALSFLKTRAEGLSPTPLFITFKSCFSSPFHNRWDWGREDVMSRSVLGTAWYGKMLMNLRQAGKKRKEIEISSKGTFIRCCLYQSCQAAEFGIKYIDTVASSAAISMAPRRATAGHRDQTPRLFSFL